MDKDGVAYDMFLGRLLVDLIKDEGLRRRPYTDTLGFQTIGIGHKVESPYPKHKVISLVEVMTMFANDVERAIHAAATVVDEASFIHGGDYRWRGLPPRTRRGLTMMAFQLGKEGLRGFKKMLRLLVLDGPSELVKEEALDSLWRSQTPLRARRVAELLTGD